uniref:Sulfhydryl oxidase n=1 Tax=Tetradesmus obliquus TaxID=3088 RepID=A0A383WB31_TETOB|eukprot:jgi/Sobl393_1/96/SZX74835.1
MAQQQTLARQQQQGPWWAEPLQGVGAAFQGMQRNMQRFADGLARPGPPGASLQASVTLAASPAASGQLRPGSSSSTPRHLDAAALHASSSSSSKQQHGSKPTSKEDLGRATWTFLHTLAAQFPEHPTRQQQRDARQLIDSLTRIYPCADCSKHFQELVRRDPPVVSSGRDFAVWMCRTHNAVNRRIGKPSFNCDLVAARWAPLDCDEHNSCDMTLGHKR